MDPKPKYVVVGAFLLLFIAVSVAFVLWMYGYRGRGEYETYVILTEESVSGIRVGSPVRYKGVDVGKVVGIEIHPEDPNIIVIFMKIKKGVPIHRDTVAQIQPVGITGLSYISLSGGKEGAPYMVKIRGKSYPLVKLELSEIQKVSRSLPELLARANELLDRMNRMFNDRNIENFSAISENLKIATFELKKLEKRISQLAEKYKTLGDKVEPVIGRLNSLIRTLNSTAVDFDNGTLVEIEKTLAESRKVLGQLEALTRRLKSDPSLILYGVPGKRGPGEGK